VKALQKVARKNKITQTEFVEQAVIEKIDGGDTGGRGRHLSLAVQRLNGKLMSRPGLKRLSLRAALGSRY
jgi:hypothetical protein